MRAPLRKICGLLALAAGFALLLPALFNEGVSKAGVTCVQFKDVDKAIALYRAAHGRLPTQMTDLLPELLRELPVDAWGRAMHYRALSDSTWSLHADGANGLDEGGAGDDLSWDPEKRACRD